MVEGKTQSESGQPPQEEVGELTELWSATGEPVSRLAENLEGDTSSPGSTSEVKKENLEFSAKDKKGNFKRKLAVVGIFGGIACLGVIAYVLNSNFYNSSAEAQDVTSVPVEVADVVALSTPTQTSTPTVSHSLTASPTPLFTPIATLTPSQIPSDVDGYDDVVYEGEMEFNNLHSEFDDDEVDDMMGSIFLNLIDRFKNDEDEYKKVNSTYSTIVNLPAEDDTNPETEPGLAHTSEDIERYKSVGSILNDINEMKADELLGTVVNSRSAVENENGMFTFGVWDRTHNRDAMILLAATAIAKVRDPDLFMESDRHLTIEEIWFDEEGRFKDVLLEIQQEILSQIQDREASTRDGKLAESDRIRSGSPDESSADIPIWARISPEYLACRYFMDTAGDRDSQTQTTRGIKHRESVNVSSFEEFRTQEVMFLGVSVDAEGKLYTAMIGFDGYKDPDNILADQELSASGEREIPCGEEEETPEQPTPIVPSSSTPTVTVVYPSQTPPVAVTFTPTIPVEGTLTSTPPVVISTHTPGGPTATFTPTSTVTVTIGLTPTDINTQIPTSTATASATSTDMATLTPLPTDTEAPPTDIPTQVPTKIPTPEAALDPNLRPEEVRVRYPVDLGVNDGKAKQIFVTDSHGFTASYWLPPAIGIISEGVRRKRKRSSGNNRKDRALKRYWNNLK